MFKHIKKYFHFFTPTVMTIIAAVFVATAVYAAISAAAAGNGAVTQFTTNWGDCKNIQNNNSGALFVPANTQGEWDAFVSNAPNKVLSSCCTANSGQACTSGVNSCNQTNSGTIQCNGTCSASTPPNPAGYGNACSVNSLTNTCGQYNTNYGTIQCDGSCSAGTPGTPANPAGYGDACTSAANSCGMTNSGTIQCDGSCSASTPSDSLCPSVTYCFSVTSDVNDISINIDGCEAQHFDMEGRTETFYCGTSYAGCVSDRDQLISDYGGYNSCTDVGASAPYWYVKLGPNNYGHPQSGCFGTYAAYGMLRSVGDVVPCDQLPSPDYCSF